jgi:hypothetical protein
VGIEAALADFRTGKARVTPAACQAGFDAARLCFAYERRSILLTSNLVFGRWDRIFRDQMATAAAIDGLVHHAVLLEFDVSSYRTERAKRRSHGGAATDAAR